MTLAIFNFVYVLLFVLATSGLPVSMGSELFPSAMARGSTQTVFHLCSSHPGIESYGDFRHSTRMDTVSASTTVDRNCDIFFEAESLDRASELSHVTDARPVGQWTATRIRLEDGVSITYGLPLGDASASLDWTSNLELVSLCSAASFVLACVALGLFAIKCIRAQVLSFYKTWWIIPHVVTLALLLLCHSWTIVRSRPNEKCILPCFTLASTSNVPATTSSDREDDSGGEKVSADPSLSPTTLKPGFSLDDQTKPLHGYIPPVPDPETHEPHSSRILQAATPNPMPPPSPNMRPFGFMYQAMPQFDIALTMQPRLGFGVGTDSGWMVRFLMTIFGWIAITIMGSH